MTIPRWLSRTVASAFVAVVGTATALAQDPNRPLAVVNGEPITSADVDAILKARPIEAMKPTSADYRALQQEALGVLIDELIMHQFLQQNAPKVATAGVETKLKELQDAIKAQGQTFADY